MGKGYSALGQVDEDVGMGQAGKGGNTTPWHSHALPGVHTPDWPITHTSMLGQCGYVGWCLGLGPVGT